jgi:predicted AAA+ superfamily ATPase
MIDREIELHAKEIATKYPVVTILGPRQSGKTTLAKKLFPKKPYVNLEHLPTRRFATSDPDGFLGQYPDGAVIDEIQRVPELTSYIQVITDPKNKNGMFILTGSHQFNLRNAVNQSLAGRTAILRLMPFTIGETQSFGNYDADDLICTGFYPRVYDQKIPASQVYADYYETYLERDLRELVNIKDLQLFERFMRLCAGRCGQLLNLNNLASDTGISQPTAKLWITVLESSFILFRLPPYHTNIRKRLIKTPKLYFYDTGLAAWLCNIENRRQLAPHPLRGSLYENMVVADILKSRFNQGRRNNLCFYRDRSGNEVDLLVPNGNLLVPIEIKSGLTVNDSYFKGIRHFRELFPDQVENAFVVYPGEMEQPRTVAKVAHHSNIAKQLGCEA